MLNELKDTGERLLVGSAFLLDVAHWGGLIAEYTNHPALTGLFAVVISIASIVVLVRRGRLYKLDEKKRRIEIELLKNEQKNKA